MPINSVIQEKRKALGLTQEQVAEYLSVSAPAVSKWESGTTSPDIELLAPLARLLKTDLNTLLCFREDMTAQEIGLFCKEISETVQEKGLSEGFKAAEQKLHDYPHNETLLYSLAFQMDGLCAMSGLSPEETNPFGEKILSWYRRLAESDNAKISASASYMIAGKLISKGDYGKAQELLDKMGGGDDLISSITDKLMLQVIIYQKQGKAEKAAGELQNALYIALNKVQLLLQKLVDAELAAGEVRVAEKIADKASQMPALFDLWSYNSYAAPLQVAAAEKDTDKCILLLRKLLASLLTPWDMSSSPLFYRTAKSARINDTKKLLPAILAEMEGSPEYGFLQDCEEFRELIYEYRALIENR